MKALYPYLLNIHIVFGALGLLSGSINLMLKKGGVIHKKIGFSFVLSMLITGISALLLATFGQLIDRFGIHWMMNYNHQS